MSRAVRPTSLALALGFAFLLGPAGGQLAAAAPVSTPYEITVEGSGSGSFNHSTCCVNDTGTMSASYKLVYDAVFTVDEEAQTVDVEALNYETPGVTAAKSFSGLDSFESTRACIGSPCTGPATICSFSSVPVGPNYVSAGNMYLQDRWGFGSDHPTYVSGNIILDQREGGGYPGGEPIACSGTTTNTYPGADKMPGLQGAVEIPLAKIGEQHFVVNNSSGTAPQSSLYEEATGQWSYTVTLDRLSTNVKIASATLDLAQRAQRRAARLHDQVVALGESKAALENEIVQESATAERAIAALGDLAPKLRKVNRALEDTLAALRDLERHEGRAPPEIRSLLRVESESATEVATLEEEIVTAERHGRSTRLMRRKLDEARRQLDGVDSVLGAKLRSTDLGSLRADWLERLRKLQAAAFDMRTADAGLAAQQGEAEAKLTEDANQLRGVDEKLFELGERLAGFEPEVQEVTAKAAGQPVFRATAAYPYANLLQLNREIAAEQAAADRIKAEKAKAFAEFREAENDAIASQKHLASLLMKLAYGRFATDLAFDSYDVVRATAKGGLVGAGAELGKKLIEKGLSAVAGEAPGGIEPGSIEAEVNREFNAGLKDSFSTPQLSRVVGERVLKETLTKSLKDGANGTLGQLVFEKVESPFRFRLEVEPRLAAGTALEYAKAEKALERLSGQLKTLRKGFLGNFAGKAAVKDYFKGLGENIAKDALKTLIKGGLDRIEQEAWIDFFIKDSIARSFYVPYHSYADLWEKALTRLDELTARKAELLKGHRDGELTTQLSLPFSWNEQIEITLVLGSRDPEEPLEALVNGTKATPVGTTDAYTVPGSTAVPGSEGMLSVVLR